MILVNTPDGKTVVLRDESFIMAILQVVDQPTRDAILQKALEVNNQTSSSLPVIETGKITLVAPGAKLTH